jgi:hypothetical protein
MGFCKRSKIISRDEWWRFYLYNLFPILWIVYLVKNKSFKNRNLSNWALAILINILLTVSGYLGLMFYLHSGTIIRMF